MEIQGMAAHLLSAQAGAKNATSHNAANIFPTIEINGTFYSLQRPESFAHWASQTPDDFVFAVEGLRYLTHLLRLREITKPLANFFGSGVLRLGHKLGPILW